MTDVSSAWEDFCDGARVLEASLHRAPDEPYEAQLRHLLIALNKFDLACLALPNIVNVNDTDEDGPSTYEARLSQARAAFPKFGPYHYVRPSPQSETEQRIASDAGVDLADILSEIDYAFWEAAALGRDDGIWVARFAYEFRIGSRLVALRAHILDLILGGPELEGQDL